LKKSQAELGKMQADADHDVDLLHRQLKRAQRKVSDLQQKVVLVPESRTADEWAELSRSAKLKAVTRERKYLINFMKSHEWRAEDLDYVRPQRDRAAREHLRVQVHAVAPPRGGR
jgi:hypothetical protein